MLCATIAALVISIYLRLENQLWLAKMWKSLRIRCSMMMGVRYQIPKVLPEMTKRIIKPEGYYSNYDVDRLIIDIL